MIDQALQVSIDANGVWVRSEREREALCALLRAIANGWPSTYARWFADSARAEALAAPEVTGRDIKLMRIVEAVLAEVL